MELNQTIMKIEYKRVILKGIILKILSKINSRLFLKFYSGSLRKAEKLHLACGEHVLEGWTNIDICWKKRVIKWDLKKGIPIRSSQIKFIYCEHFIEHLAIEDGMKFLLECYRVLDNGGVLRLSTPDLQFLITAYSSKRIQEWNDVHWFPASPCKMVNQGMRSWGHKYIYDNDELKKVLEEVGFSKILQKEWGKSGYKEMHGIESRPFHGEIIVEATK